MKKAMVCLWAVGSFAASANAVEQSPLCASNQVLIERALRLIARDLTGVTSDALDAKLNGTPEPSVAKPAVVASAWSQINASLMHMQQLKCEPYPLTIDPTQYYTAVFRCNAEKRRDGPACNSENWKRSEWTDHR
jgi:hypothetical protein